MIMKITWISKAVQNLETDKKRESLKFTIQIHISAYRSLICWNLKVSEKSENLLISASFLAVKVDKVATMTAISNKAKLLRGFTE